MRSYYIIIGEYDFRNVIVIRERMESTGVEFQYQTLLTKLFLKPDEQVLADKIMDLLEVSQLDLTLSIPEEKVLESQRQTNLYKKVEKDLMVTLPEMIEQFAQGLRKDFGI